MENQTNLELNAQAEDALRVSAKSSMFLAIIGFIGIALMVILAFIMTTAMSSIPDDVYGNSPFGAMKGHFNMINFTSTRNFKVIVPTFKLSAPFALN